MLTELVINSIKERANIPGLSTLTTPTAHRAAGADPLSVGDLGERRVQAVDVVGRGARVAAQQLPAVFAHPAELHVVVVLLHLSGVAVVLLGVRALLPGLPLDALLLLGEKKKNKVSRSTSCYERNNPPSRGET